MLLSPIFMLVLAPYEMPEVPVLFNSCQPAALSPCGLWPIPGAVGEPRGWSRPCPGSAPGPARLHFANCPHSRWQRPPSALTEHGGAGAGAERGHRRRDRKWRPPVPAAAVTGTAGASGAPWGTGAGTGTSVSDWGYAMASWETWRAGVSWGTGAEPELHAGPALSWGSMRDRGRPRALRRTRAERELHEGPGLHAGPGPSQSSVRDRGWAKAPWGSAAEWGTMRDWDHRCPSAWPHRAGAPGGSGARPPGRRDGSAVFDEGKVSCFRDR